MPIMAKRYSKAFILPRCVIGELMEKQTFKTKRSKREKYGSKIVVVLHLLTIIGITCNIILISGEGIEAWVSALQTPSGIMIFALILVIAFFMSCFIFVPIYAFRSGRRLRLKKDTQFNANMGITYWRDTFNDVSPVMISILQDLSVEHKKDVTAVLLKLYQKGAVTFEDGKIVKTYKWDSLNNCETELLDILSPNGTLPVIDLIRWKEKEFKRAVDKGYIRVNKKKYFAKGYFLTCGISLVSAIALTNIFHLFLETPLIFVISSAMVLSYLTVFASFWIGIIKIIGYHLGKALANYERTPLGDEMTEKIMGLRNYIRDFSLLTSRDKEQVILWEDFLVYAVVLEENESIVKDICKMYNINYYDAMTDYVVN